MNANRRTFLTILLSSLVVPWLEFPTERAKLLSVCHGTISTQYTTESGREWIMLNARRRLGRGVRIEMIEALYRPNPTGNGKLMGWFYNPEFYLYCRWGIKKPIIKKNRSLPRGYIIHERIVT